MGLKFVSLHNHTGFSVYDGIGSPDDLLEWNLKNAGEDSGAFAITDHGSINAAGAIAALQKKIKQKGIPQKIIWGCEFYYIPSLKQWEIDKFNKVESQKLEKKKKQEETTEEDLVIENEKESKAKHFADPVNRRNHLVITAINQVGLRNLFRLVSRSYRQGFYRKPRIDLEMLRECNEGLMASTACLAGIPSWCSLQPGDSALKLYDAELLPLMEIFGKDRFFLELQFNRIPEQQIVNKDIIQYSKQTGYRLIATADCHYPDPQMFKDREIYKLLGYQMQKENIDLSILDKKITDLDAELFLKNGDQMFAAYRESFASTYEDDTLIKEAIERTHDLAHNLVEYVSPEETIKLPKTFVVTEKVKTPFDKLKEFCLKALKDKNLQTKEYIDRTAYELNVIKKLKVEEYFLALKEMLDVIRKRQLTGVGRGSGGGSLVCYLLNITFLDPVKNGLLFERFLSPSRAEMPDIDSDVENKEEAFDLIRAHFGNDNVLSISNYNRLQLKSLVKDIARLYSVSFDEVNECTRLIEKEARSAILDEIGNDQKLYELTYERAMKHSPTFKKFIEKYPQVGERIENLYREIKSIGKHAGGILVVPDAECHLPIIRIRGSDQSPITEGITAQHLKHFGLVKFDMLGLATLRIIRRCIELILRDVKGISNPTIDDVWDFYNKNLHPDIIDPKDPKIFANVYKKGNFPSIFQFAEKNVQNFCVKAEPNTVGDLSNITSLWRPGPLTGGADKKYLFYDPIAASKEHALIQEILGESRGLLVFQEQFMQLAHKLAGFPLEETDKLRKLLVKASQEFGEEMKKQRIEIGDKFIQGCIERGLSEARAKKLWHDEILGFISYGFNKSHSHAYAYNSYQCAFLYTFFEDQWIKACLECDPKPDEIINSVRMLGYKVEKPDVNSSTAIEWTVGSSMCFPPFTSLKGVGAIAANELVEGRPQGGFSDIQSFFYDENGAWRWSKANKKVLEILMKMQAFDSLKCIGPVFKNYRHMHDFVLNNYDALKKGKIKLSEAMLTPIDDWTAAEKITLQREIVGFYDKNLIVRKFLKTFEEFEICAIDECDDEKKKVRVWAVVEKIIQKTTKNGKPFLVVTASGTTDKPYNFRVWDVNAQMTQIWIEGNVAIFGLDYSEEFGYSLSKKVKPMRVTK